MESQTKDNDCKSSMTLPQQNPHNTTIRTASTTTSIPRLNAATTTTTPTASDTAICESVHHDCDLRVPYYCEENVWRLAYRKLHYNKLKNKQIEKVPNISKSLVAVNDDNETINHERYYVAFISNQHKCVPMYHQRAASAASSVQGNEKPCCYWDYHVILLGVTTTTDKTILNESDRNDNVSNKSILVYDIDTTIVPYPVPLHQYLTLSFPLEYFASHIHNSHYLDYKPYFRIIPAEKYIQYFTSDRSHMFNEITNSYNEPPPPYSCIVATTSTNDRTIPSLDNSESIPQTNDPNNGAESYNTIQSNFHIYVDFATNQIGSPETPFGTILSLEQLMQYDF
jgi:hypothetical protein